MFNLYRRNVKQFSGSSWLLIFHHDSIGDHYFTKENCKYNIEPQLYSIIDDEDLYSLSYKKFGFYYFLLEYPEINSYQIFMQKEYITSTSDSVGYKKVLGDSWDTFNGLAKSYYYDETLIDGSPGYTENNWFTAIGTWGRAFSPRIPGPIFNWVEIYVYNVNLWIMIPKIPTLFCKYNFNINSILTSVLILT